MNIAVVGGGIFGCMIAADLARTGFKVTLFEARTDILDGACARNQARLHYGYHYPRSDATARSAKKAATIFEARYHQVIKRARHWYVLAPGSKVQPCEYKAFLDRHELPYEEVSTTEDSLPKPMQVHTANMIIRAQEGFIDVELLRRLLRSKFRMHNVTLKTQTTIYDDMVPGFDYTVWATYGVPWHEPLRYEVCETAILELGRYNNDSFVIIDGEYGGLDPWRRGLYMMYDVKHSVHHVSEGLCPDVPPEYQALLDRTGIIRSPLSRFDQMVDSLSRFLWGLRMDGQHTSIYHGSMWSLRAVLPNVDDTDARPTIVRREGHVLRVLPGKMCEAPLASEAVLQNIYGRVPV